MTYKRLLEIVDNATGENICAKLFKYTPFDYELITFDGRKFTYYFIEKSKDYLKMETWYYHVDGKNVKDSEYSDPFIDGKGKKALFDRLNNELPHVYKGVKSYNFD